MSNVARGKALVAKLRARSDVRDPEALAAWLGMVKKLRKGGMSTKSAMEHASDPELRKNTSALAKIAGEYTAQPKSKDETDREKYEASVIKQMEKAQTSTLYRAILEQGGIKTSDELREEYQNIPNTFKRKDGLSGDEMAEYLKTYYAELGIESENDLLDFFWDRRMAA